MRTRRSPISRVRQSACPDTPGCGTAASLLQSVTVKGKAGIFMGGGPVWCEWLMREVVGRALHDPALGIDSQVFANPAAALVRIKHHDAVGTDEQVDQLEVQIGYQLKRFSPICPQLGLAA